MAMMVTGIVVELEDKTDKGLRKLNNRLNKFGLNAKKVGKNAGRDLTKPLRSAFNSISKFARDSFFMMETFGRAARMAFRGMVAPIVSATKASLSFEKRMAEVMTLLQGVEGAPAMEDLKRQVMSLSREFGQMPEDQVKSLYQIISAGALEGSNALGTLRAANMLAVGGLTDTASAASAIATVVNAFNVGFENAEHIANLFFKTVQKGVTTVPQLTQKIGLVAGTAGSAGMSLESLFSSIAVGTKAIGNTAFTITGLNMAITALRAPGKTAQEEFERLGIEFGDAAVTGDNFIKTMTQLAQRQDLSSASLKKMFPQVRALRFIFAATSDTASDFNKQLADMKGTTDDVYSQFEQSRGAANLLNKTLIDFKENADKAAESAFKVIEATAGFQLDRVISSFETLKILFGDLFVSSAGLGSVFKGMAEGLGVVGVVLEEVLLTEDATAATADNLEKLGKGLVFLGTDMAISAISVVSQLVKVLSRLNVMAAVAAKFVPDDIILGDPAKTLPKELVNFKGAVVQTFKELGQAAPHSAEGLLETYNDRLMMSEVATRVYGKALESSREKLDKVRNAGAALAAKQQELQEKYAAGGMGVSEYENAVLNLNLAMRQQQAAEAKAERGLARSAKKYAIVKQRVKDLTNVEEMREEGVYKALAADEEAGKVTADLQVKLLKFRKALADAQGDKNVGKQAVDNLEAAEKLRKEELKKAEEAARKKAAADAARKKKEQEQSEAAKEAFIRRIAELTTAEIARFDTLAKEHSDYLRGTATREMAYRDFKVKILEGLSKDEKALAKKGFQLADRLDRQALRLKKQRAKEALEFAKSTLTGGMDVGVDAAAGIGSTPLRMSGALADVEIAKAREAMTAQLTMIDNLASYANLSEEERGEMRLRAEQEVLAEALEINKAFYRKGIALANSAYKTIAQRAKEAYQGDVSAQMDVVRAAATAYRERLSILTKGMSDEVAIEFAKNQAKREILDKYKIYEQEAARKGVSIVNEGLDAESQKRKDSVREIEQFAESVAGTIVGLGSTFVKDLIDDQTTVEEAFRNLGSTLIEMILTSLAEFIIAEGIKAALLTSTATAAVTADQVRLASGLATDAALIKSATALTAAKSLAAGSGLGALGFLGLAGLGIAGITSLFAFGGAGHGSSQEKSRVRSQNVGKAQQFLLGDSKEAREQARLDRLAKRRKEAVGFAMGGLVRGGIPGRDSVPAMLMPGEFVLSRSIVDSIRRGMPANAASMNTAPSQPSVVFAPVIQTVALPNSAQNQRYYRDTVKRTQDRLASNGY